MLKLATVIPAAGKAIASAVVIGGAALVGTTHHHDCTAELVRSRLSPTERTQFDAALRAANDNLRQNGLTVELAAATQTETNQTIAAELWPAVFAGIRSGRLSSPGAIEPGYIAVPRIESGHVTFQFIKASDAGERYHAAPAARSLFSI